ncbi:MAG: hypothetical protein ACFFC6_14370 [Promethearchaeota archaeon]
MIFFDFQYTIYRAERFRFSPILDSPSNILISTANDVFGKNVKITWQMCYNFRSHHEIQGCYSLFLNNREIESGGHISRPFWLSSNLRFDLGRLGVGSYNCTLVLTDEGGHQTSDTVTIQIESSTKPMNNTFLQNNSSEPRIVSYSPLGILGCILIIAYCRISKKRY